VEGPSERRSPGASWAGPTQFVPPGVQFVRVGAGLKRPRGRHPIATGPQQARSDPIPEPPAVGSSPTRGHIDCNPPARGSGTVDHSGSGT
jgi:hypothetical protein